MRIKGDKMILQTLSLLKAKLVIYPETEDEKTRERKPLGKFTVGKYYRIIAIYDPGKGFTDFLVADDAGVFYWIKMNAFRSK